MTGWIVPPLITTNRLHREWSSGGTIVCESSMHIAEIPKPEKPHKISKSAIIPIPKWWEIWK